MRIASAASATNQEGERTVSVEKTVLRFDISMTDTLSPEVLLQRHSHSADVR